jgi:hypothetical protein
MTKTKFLQGARGQVSQGSVQSEVRIGGTNIQMDLSPSMRRPIPVKSSLCSFRDFFRFLAVQPSRLCRHPSIRTLVWAIFVRCQWGVLDSVDAAIW